MEAASVGAATPAMIEPSTAPTSASGGRHDAQELARQLAAGNEVALLLRHRRHHVGPEDAEPENVDDVDARQHQAWDHRGGEQRADRFVEDVGEQDQDQARRDDLAQRAGGADDAAGQALVVATPQQRRQSEQAERYDRGADDAGGGAHEHADDDDADTEPATQVSGRMRDHVHQIFGELGFLQHHAHEDEQRHGDQRVVRHHAEDAAWKQIEQQRAEADIAKYQTGRRQRQSNRDARQQQDEERRPASGWREFH